MSFIPVEVFATYIVEKIKKQNPHFGFAVDESAAVLGGAVVHIPQAGASPNVVKNRSSFPATAVQRGDNHITYALDVYTTDPTHITWAEENENSYDKTNSVLNDHVATLVESVGDNAFYNWVHGLEKVNGAYVVREIPAANIIRTSGSLVDANPNDGQTGLRNAMIHQDLSKAQAMMNKSGVSKDNRYACMESYMYQQLVDSLTPNMMAAFQAGADIKMGVVGMLYGFKVMERGSVLAFAPQTLVPLVPEQAIDEEDHIGCLCWQQDSVAIAKGDIKPFDDKGNPQYYGDIFSALVKTGGRCRREDWKGVLCIVQGGQELALSVSALSFVAGGESKTVTITANGAYTVAVTGTGFSVDTANNVITVTAAANAGAERTGTVTVTMNADAARVKTVALTQAAGA